MNILKIKTIDNDVHTYTKEEWYRFDIVSNDRSLVIKNKDFDTIAVFPLENIIWVKRV